MQWPTSHLHTYSNYTNFNTYFNAYSHNHSECTAPRSVQNRSAHYLCRTVVPGAARGYMAPSYFGRSVNPTYLKRGVDYAHQTLTVPSDFRPSYGPAMETEYYRGSLYVKTYHVTLLNTSNCLGGQLSPYATESKNVSLHSTECATVTNKLYD